MSFLVASGHVSVEAKTDDAKRDIERLITTLGGLRPATTTAAGGLEKLRDRAATAARALSGLGDKASDAERALIGLRAVAGTIKVTAEFEDDTTSGVATVRAAIQDLEAQGPVRLSVTFDGQAAQITAAAQAMRDLRGDAAGAGTALGRLTTRAVAAAVALNALEQQAEDASRALRDLRGRAVAAAFALIELRDRAASANNALRTLANRAETTDSRLNDLSTRTRVLRRDMDDLDDSVRRTGTGMGGLRGSLGSVGGSMGNASGGTRKLMLAAIALSPALIPIAAALVPIVAGTAAAAVGVGVFGLAIGRQVAAMSKATEAANAYQDAVKAHGGAGSQEAAEAAHQLQIALADMPQATQEAAAGLMVFKEVYKGWSDSLAADTMPVVTKSFAVFGALLPRMSPLVRGTATELDRMMTVLAGGIQSAGFERFMDKLSGWASGALARATAGMVKFSQSLDTGEVGSNVDEFMDYVRQHGPIVGETLGNLAKAMTHLIVAASDMGVSVLTVVNAFAGLVNAIPTSVLSNMLQLYVTLKLVSMGVAALGAVTGGAAVARLAAYFAVMRAAGVGTTLRATAASMTAMTKATVGLGVLAVAAIGISKLAEKARGAPPDVDRLTTSLKQLASTGKFTGELQKTFGDIDGLVAKVKKLQTETDKAKETAFGFRIPVLDDVADWIANKTNDMAKGGESLTALTEDFKGLDAALAGMVGSGHATQAAQDFNVIKTALLDAGYSTKEINKLFPEYVNGVAGLKSEQQLAAQGMGVFGQQALLTKQKLDAQKASADGLRQSIINLNDTNRAAYDAQIAFEGAIDSLTASFKEHGASLDLDTEAGRKNGTAMSAAAKANDELLAAGIAAGDSLGSMTTKSGTLRAEMMRLATEGFGGNKKKATEYVNTLLGTPGEIKTMVRLERKEAISGLKGVQAEIKKTPGAKSVKVTTLNAAAIKALESVGLKTRNLPDGRTEVYTKNGQSLGSIGSVLRALNNLDGKTANTYTTHTVTYHKRTTYDTDGSGVPDMVQAPGRASGGPVRRYAGGGNVQAFPAGGYVSGPGTGTSDSILAMMGSGAMARVSDTEYVVRAAAVAKYGVGFMDALNAGRLRLPGFAKGGLTTKQKAAREAAKRREAEKRKREQEARGSLKNNATLTDMSIIAGGKNAEISSTLGKERSEGALVDFLNQLQTTVSKAGFSPKTNSALQKQITASARKLFAQNDALDKVTASLDKAKSGLDDLKGKFDSLKTSVASSLIGFANVTKIGKYGTSPQTLIKQLQSDTTRTTEFSKQLQQLKAKGLNATALADIAQAGVTGGGMATAQSLLTATPEEIAKINQLQKQLAASANTAGKTTADAMYGAGIKAAEGLVAGLTAKKSAIEAAMMSIAKAMEASIKKALGIRSPAKRMEPVGDFAMRGVEVGWTKRLAKGRTLLSGSAAPVYRPSMLTAPGASTPQGAGAGIVINLSPTFHTMTLPSVGERKAFAKAMAAEFSDAIRERDRERRR